MLKKWGGGDFLNHKVIPYCFSKAWNKEKISSRSFYLLFCLTLLFWHYLTSWILKLNLRAHGCSFEASLHGLWFWPFTAYVTRWIELESFFMPFELNKFKHSCVLILYETWNGRPTYLVLILCWGRQNMFSQGTQLNVDSRDHPCIFSRCLNSLVFSTTLFCARRCVWEGDGECFS